MRKSSPYTPRQTAITPVRKCPGPTATILLYADEELAYAEVLWLVSTRQCIQ